jgi:hypothetical protein
MRSIRKLYSEESSLNQQENNELTQAPRLAPAHADERPGHGGVKEDVMTERGQQKDIDKAKALHHEYKVRKKSKSAARKSEKNEVVT